MNDPHCLWRAKSWYVSNELTWLFELLISLLGINGVPRVIDDKQEVGYTPAIHPASSDVRKKDVHWKSKGWGLSFQMVFPVHVWLNKPRIAAKASHYSRGKREKLEASHPIAWWHSVCWSRENSIAILYRTQKGCVPPNRDFPGVLL